MNRLTYLTCSALFAISSATWASKSIDQYTQGADMLLSSTQIANYNTLVTFDPFTMSYKASTSVSSGGSTQIGGMTIVNNSDTTAYVYLSNVVQTQPPTTQMCQINTDTTGQTNTSCEDPMVPQHTYLMITSLKSFTSSQCGSSGGVVLCNSVSTGVTFGSSTNHCNLTPITAGTFFSSGQTLTISAGKTCSLTT